MANPPFDPARDTPHDEVVHVLAHTHWDREWYLPAGRFRQRLVALIDELLDGVRTRDLGGTAGTDEFTEAIVGRL